MTEEAPISKKESTKIKRELFDHLYSSADSFRKFKIFVLRLEKYVIDIWSQLDSLTPENRQQARVYAELISAYKRMLESAEDYHRKYERTQQKFKLYKHPTKREVVIINSYYKPHEKKYGASTWTFPTGLPTPKNPLKVVYSRLWRVIPPKYLLIDSGTAERRVLWPGKNKLILIGKKQISLYLKAKWEDKQKEGDVTVSLKPIKSKAS